MFHFAGIGDIVPSIERPIDKLADEFAFAGVLQDDGRRVEVFGDVFERKMDVIGAGAEEALGASDLSIKQLVADAGGIPVLFTHRPANAGE